MTQKVQVWWIPQVPMEPFIYDVPSVEHGNMLMDALAKYDAFQFENDIKPDYSNSGGIRVSVGEDWEDLL